MMTETTTGFALCNRDVQTAGLRGSWRRRLPLIPQGWRWVTIVAFLAHGAAASAATRYVAATGADSGDCSAIGSPCLTIGYALGQCNLAGGDTISVAAGTYTTTAEVNIDRSVTITGAGATSTIVQAAASAGTATHRLFKNNNVTTTIQDLTLRYGVETSGGAINNQVGTLTLNRVTVSDNQVKDLSGVGLNGGAISINGGTLTINSSTINNNSVTTSDASSNVRGSGGGIFVGSGSTVNLNDSTVSGNSAIRGGGGLFTNGGTVNVIYSTITNNTSNSADVAASTSVDGGGINRNSGTLNVTSSLVAGNKKGLSSPVDSDCAGTITSQGYNLTGASTGCSLSGTGDLTVSPATVFTTVLAALADNGGSTSTHALRVGGAAVDVIPGGVNSCGLGQFASDQRGGARPYNGTCDIGAYELQTVEYVSTSGVDSGDCTLTACLTLEYAYSKSQAGNTINVAVGTYTTTAELDLTRSLTITGAGAASTIIQAAASPGIATHRLFKNNTGSSSVIQNMTLRYGVEASGGALTVQGGSLTFNNVAIRENQVKDTGSAGLNGGAISINGGSVTINNSTISGNSVTTSDTSGSVRGSGGGIFLGTIGTVTVNNSTISGNTAIRGGGGLFTNGGTINLNYSTVANNTSNNTDASALTSVDGGGVNRRTGTINLKSSIVAGNKRGTSSPADSDCAGTMTSQGYNLTGAGTGCSLSGTGDLTVSPATVFSSVLGALANNGGATLTHAPAAGSPALDHVPAGTNQCGSTPFDLDQRGLARPSGGLCDVGSVELASADLAVTVSDGVATAIPGGTVTYTIAVSNPSGSSNAPAASVTDTFPAPLTCTWTCSGAGGGTCTAAGSGNIADTAGLPVGASVTYAASCAVSAAATGTLANTATVGPGSGVTDPTPANDSATDTDALTPQANLGITKTDGVTTATPGGTVTYTLVASNPAGPSDAPAATVTDAFPASLTCTWTCSGAGGGTCTAAGSGNIADAAGLPVGASVTYTASCAVSAAATGTLANTATVGPGSGVTDPTPANDSATDTDTLAPEANLGITKTDGVTSAAPGGTVTYTLVASNPAGPSDAPAATVTDTFPAALTCTWTCAGAGGGTCTAAGSGNIADTAGLPVGASVTYTASCSVSLAASGTLVNTASVGAGAGVTDPTPANDSATDTDTLAPQADLAITKTDGVGATTPGGSLSYTIVASNPAGPSHAPAANVIDTLPSSLTCTWTCAGSGGGTCTAAGSGSIADAVGLPVGASVTYTVSCTVSETATNLVTNTATVAASGGVIDAEPANNSATDVDTLPLIFADGFETGTASRWSDQAPARLVVWRRLGLSVGERAELDYDLALLATERPLAGPLAAIVDEHGTELFSVEMRTAGRQSVLRLRLVATAGGSRLASSWQEVAARVQDLRLEWQPGEGGDADTLALYLDGRLALWLNAPAAPNGRPAAVWVYRPEVRTGRAD